MAIKQHKIERKKLSELDKWVDNPRIITEEQFGNLKNSINEFGLVEFIVWNKRSGRIVSGHQRYEALYVLGVKSADVVVVDLSDKDEKKLNLTMNNKHNQGTWDKDLLSEALEELKLEDNYSDLALDKLEPLDLSDSTPQDADETVSFDTASAKKIELVYGNEDYPEIIKQLKRIMDIESVENNSEAVRIALREYTENHAN